MEIYKFDNKNLNFNEQIYTFLKNLIFLSDRILKNLGKSECYVLLRFKWYQIWLHLWNLFTFHHFYKLILITVQQKMYFFPPDLGNELVLFFGKFGKQFEKSNDS